jgi:hypothetical protein
MDEHQEPENTQQSNARSESGYQPPAYVRAAHEARPGWAKTSAQRATYNILAGLILLALVGACIGIGVKAFGSADNNTNITSNSATSTAVVQAEPTYTPTITPTLGPSPTPTTTPTPKPTATPTRVPQWTTIQTFKGNGTKKTTTFTVPNSWRLAWSCNPSSFGGSYNVIVDVYNSDGSLADPAAVNTICQAGNTSDSTQEYTGGTLYLDVTSEAVWSIQVQVLQ